MKPRRRGGSGAWDGDGNGEPHGCERKEACWEEGSAALGGLERSGDGTQRKATGSTGLAVSAGIVGACDKKMLVSYNGQQRGGSRRTVSGRTDVRS